ncbi:hypothetical protein FOFC_18166 [Fusarium oxysporum]|nr:hypothetical protein FOFC_18166 [Fusarium oxysporum]
MHKDTSSSPSEFQSRADGIELQPVSLILQVSPVIDVSILAHVRTNVPVMVALKAFVEKLRWLSTKAHRTNKE